MDREAPVTVHGEQYDFAGVVEPGGSGHVHPALPGGHDGRDRVPWHRRNGLVSAGPQQGWGSVG